MTLCSVIWLRFMYITSQPSFYDNWFFVVVHCFVFSSRFLLSYQKDAVFLFASYWQMSNKTWLNVLVICVDSLCCSKPSDCVCALLKNSTIFLINILRSFDFDSFDCRFLILMLYECSFHFIFPFEHINV